jgi:hypothetical protein
MNYYRVEVELGYIDNGEYTFASQDVFYIHQDNGLDNVVDFDYVKRIINNKFGLNYDTIDIVVELIANDTKFK